MRFLIILVALCGCQASGPPHLYDGPKRTPSETAIISLVPDLDAPPLAKGAFIPTLSNFVEANGYPVNDGNPLDDWDVVVLPGKQRLTIQGRHHTGRPPTLVSSLPKREQDILKILRKQIHFTAEAGKQYHVIARPTKNQAMFEYYVLCEKAELPDVVCHTLGRTDKLPDLQLGPDWLPIQGWGNWSRQYQSYVGIGERPMKWTKKVILASSTDAALSSGFSLESVTKTTGRDMYLQMSAPGSRIYDLQIGDDHWVTRWRSAYKDGKGLWGVTVYRVHGPDIVMLAYGGMESSDPGVLDQWTQRFLEAKLPTPR
ncbi:MAG: hypothetical protein P1V35_08390 [Planctomycetota bacterium]|nr:hypothetical protein [Planctomycetota bacterium]